MENRQGLAKKIGKTSLLASTLFVAGIFTTQSNASADENWTANSVETVRQNVNQANQSNYGVRYGDTLWALSQVTHQSVAQLAQQNGVVNPDLIYAGSSLNLNGQVQANQMALKEAQAVAVDKQNDAQVAKQAAQAAQTQADQLVAEQKQHAQVAAQAKQVQVKADAKVQERAKAAEAQNQQVIAKQARQQAQTKAEDARVAQMQATQQAKSLENMTTQQVKPKPQPVAPKDNVSTSQDVPQTGDATFVALNQLRQVNGLAPVAWDAGLAAQAASRAAQINASQSVPNDHFTGSGNEVIAIGWDAGTPVINAWYNETNMIGAPGHRNWEMNANYTKVGFAQVGNTIVGLAQ